jgi:autotransporter family porin
LQVSGNGSTVTAGTLDVGQGGMGSLFILNGGVVTAPQATLGVATGSNGTVVVDGAGSQWLTSGLVTIADQGDGVLTLQNGGVAEATTAFIGAQGVGTVNVGDAGSHWQIGGDIVVGGTETAGAGTGNLSVLGGGLVTSSNGFIGAPPDRTAP